MTTANFFSVFNLIYSFFFRRQKEFCKLERVFLPFVLVHASLPLLFYWCHGYLEKPLASPVQHSALCYKQYFLLMICLLLYTTVLSAYRVSDIYYLI